MAVDRIDNDAPGGLGRARAARKSDGSAGESLGDQDDGRVGGDFSLEELDELLFADPVDVVDRVPFFVSIDLRKRVGSGRLTRLDNLIANRLVDPA